MTEERCAFCREGRMRVGRLISCPRAMICDACVAHASEFAAGLTGDPRAMAQPCSFCEQSVARGQFTSRHATICDACIGLCVEVIAEQDQIQPLPMAYVVKN